MLVVVLLLFSHCAGTEGSQTSWSLGGDDYETCGPVNSCWVWQFKCRAIWVTLTEATKPQPVWEGQTRLPNSVTYNLNPKRKEGYPGAGRAFGEREHGWIKQQLQRVWEENNRIMKHGYDGKKWLGTELRRQQGQKVKKPDFYLRAGPLAAVVANWIMEQHKNRPGNPGES